MADENLRLAAEIVDKWSGPLKQMQQSLRNFSDLAKKGQRESGLVRRTSTSNNLCCPAPLDLAHLTGCGIASRA